MNKHFIVSTYGIPYSRYLSGKSDSLLSVPYKFITRNTIQSTGPHLHWLKLDVKRFRSELVYFKCTTSLFLLKIYSISSNNLYYSFINLDTDSLNLLIDNSEVNKIFYNACNRWSTNKTFFLEEFAKVVPA